MSTFAVLMGFLCSAPPGPTATAARPRIVERAAVPILGLAFSPDHQAVAIGEDAVLRLVEFKGGATQGLLVGHAGMIRAVAFSPDGRRVATGALDGTLRIWDVATRRQLDRADVPNCITLAYAPDGRTLVSGHYDPKRRFIGLMVWEIAPDAPPKTLKRIDTWSLHGHRQIPHLLRYSPDGRRVAFGSGAVNILDVSCGEVRTIEDPATKKSPIASYLFLDDKGWLVSANYIGDLTIWDFATGTALFHLSSDGTHALAIRITSMERVPGTDTVITASEWHTLTAWDLKSRNVPQNSAPVDLPKGVPWGNALLVISADCSGLAACDENFCLFDVKAMPPK